MGVHSLEFLGDVCGGWSRPRGFKHFPKEKSLKGNVIDGGDPGPITHE